MARRLVLVAGAEPAVGECGGNEEQFPFSFDPDLDSATIDVK
jgi:hypothetical protein